MAKSLYIMNGFTTNNPLLRVPQDLKVKMETAKREIAEAETLPADFGENPIKQESPSHDASNVACWHTQGVGYKP